MFTFILVYVVVSYCFYLNMAINQKITDVINNVLSEQQDGHQQDAILSEQSQVAAQCAAPINTTNTRANNNKKKKNKQTNSDLKRLQPDERSPEGFDNKKSRDDDISDITSPNCEAGQSFVVDNLVEIERLRACAQDMTQGNQAQCSPLYGTIMTNLQPLIIKEVQNAFKSVIDRLDFLEEKFRKIDPESINKDKHTIRYLEDRVDMLEQYSRRQQLIFDGIPESNAEDTDIAVINKCAKVNVTLTPLDIQRSHRLGRPREGRPRPIIAHFSHYKHKRSIVQAAKKDLFEKLNAAKNGNTKKFKVAIQVKECLTSKRAEMVRFILGLKEKRKVKSVWTEDGVIVIRLPESDKLIRINTESEYRAFVNNLD